MHACVNKWRFGVHAFFGGYTQSGEFMKIACTRKKGVTRENKER